MLTFKDLAIGQAFSFNGLDNCIKKSSRTAYISSSLWFYFGLNERVTLNLRMYKVGFYNNKGDRILQDTLKPMTHKQACTFKSKMMYPNKHFLYEV